MSIIKRILEDELTDRIIEDMDHILTKGWADTIDITDLGHGHVSVYDGSHLDRLAKFNFRLGELFHSYKNEKDVVELIEQHLRHLHIVMLYHTRENETQCNDPNRNIKSDPGSKPIVIHPSYAGFFDRDRLSPISSTLRSGIKPITVYSRDIGLVELFDVEFVRNPNGKQLLSIGDRIDIYYVANTF